MRVIMDTFPQLIEEDLQRLNKELKELLRKTDATIAAVIDFGGFLITSQGSANDIDLTTIAALSSGTYLANQSIANLVNETNFSCVYQQGEKQSIFIVSVNEYGLLAIIFTNQSGVGIVKHYAAGAIRRIAEQLDIAHERDPNGGLNLSEIDLADPGDFFKKD